MSGPGRESQTSGVEGGKFNVARFFAEQRQIGWVILIATLVWGGVAYTRMAQRKDPEIKIKTSVVTTVWPGAKADDVEQLVTRPIELLARQVAHVDKVTSTSRTGLSTIFVTLEDTTKLRDVDPAWEDLRARLELLRNLPAGARQPMLNTHFGDTATVVYSVASPPADEIEIDVRAAAIERAVTAQRSTRPGRAARAATVFGFPPDVSRETVAAAADRYRLLGEERGAFTDAAVVWGGAFVALDYEVRDERQLAALGPTFRQQVVGGEPAHPDVWPPVVVRDLRELRAQLAAVAPDKYSYRRLDEATTLLRDELARLPGVGRVERYGVVPERIVLSYSQQRLVAFGLQPAQIGAALRARNITLPGGAIGTGRQSVIVDPSGAFTGLDDVLDTFVATTKDGRAVTVRDVAQGHRTYETPIADASYLVWRDGRGWHRTRSFALAIEARSGVQATKLGQELDAALGKLRARLPADLVIEKTADQPQLVRSKIHEFMRSLAEAVAIVVAIALLFMERRSAVMVAASIPLSLAMTFGFMDLLRIDLQQVSIASLIIALGLLVDDPVIASDAINREMAAGASRERASWLGPVKLAKAILYATLTNIVAFAPLLLINGTMGDFIYSLPVVVSLALLSSRIVSMTFLPLLGQYLLRGQAGLEAGLEGEGRTARFARAYEAAIAWVLDHKAKAFVGFAIFLVVGLSPALLIRTHFFPEESLERFYVHVKLPEGADIRATQEAAERARQVIVATEGERLQRVTMFVGNGGPRWWSNVNPEPRNPAYALFIVQVKRAEESGPMVGRLQAALSAQVPGARFEAYRLSSGAPQTIPVEVRISGPDMDTLRALAEQTKGILRQIPVTGEVTDDWGEEMMTVRLAVDAGRANRSSVTHEDVAVSSATALSGQPLTQLRDRDRLIDVVLRLQPSERAEAAQVRDLYVWGRAGGRAVPLEQVAEVRRGFEPQKIVRYNQERTLTVGAIPRPGELPSTLLKEARARLERQPLPAGYSIEYGGELEQQAKAFANVRIALWVSVALIFLVLTWQFRSVVKPLIVFAAIPFGLVGAVLGLVLSRTNFGFMAFLGVASLIGVIVSHIIVLNDFIEHSREQGVPLHRAVIRAGLVRLRPVLVTVLATVGGLVPLALEGGPMWQQLVYVQIGGLLLASVVTLGLVPLLYVVFVETFGIIKWESSSAPEVGAGAGPASPVVEGRGP